MKTVWKYQIPIQDFFELELPGTHKILKVDVQSGKPMIWVQVDPLSAKTESKFRLAGTGHEIQDGHYNDYIGSFQIRGGSLVFHLFRIY